MLFYRILEKVLLSEQKSCKSVSAILEQDVFIKVNQFFFYDSKGLDQSSITYEEVSMKQILRGVIGASVIMDWRKDGRTN